MHIIVMRQFEHNFCSQVATYVRYVHTRHSLVARCLRTFDFQFLFPPSNPRSTRLYLFLLYASIRLFRQISLGTRMKDNSSKRWIIHCLYVWKITSAIGNFSSGNLNRTNHLQIIFLFFFFFCLNRFVEVKILVRQNQKLFNKYEKKIFIW